MTEIEQKALELVNEVLAEWGVLKNAVEIPKNSDAFARALLRAIEQHEAFRQEVSDAVAEWHSGHGDDERVYANLTRFIISKPDPLVEVLADMGLKSKGGYDWASEFRNTLARRGLEIREKAE